MRKGQDRKVNIAGRAGCLGLLALGLALVNPIGTSAPAFAEGEDGVADDVVPLADTPSTVGISFSPARYYAELAPTDDAGQSARIDLQTTIYVYNSGGYSVYLKSDSPNLVGEKNSENFIPGTTTAKTYANMDVNTWGYAWATDAMNVSNDVTYKAVAASGNGDKLAENTSNDIEVDTKTIALSFATKINDQMPADTYSNTMILSVVSSPAQTVIPWDEMTTMQEMTSKACAMATTGASKQLEDVRDGKFYWVSKLADGKCWMTQNLDLDLSTKVALTPADSDVKENWTPGFDTATVADEDTVNNTSWVETRSWSLGNYRIVNPNTVSTCGNQKGNASQCTSQFTEYTTPISSNGDELAHYILGNHYQWNAATAGTGGSITSGLAAGSICPKGWRLPTSSLSSSGYAGELAVLVAALGGTSSTDNVTMAPFYGVRGGTVRQGPSEFFLNAGNVGSYWSSVPVSSYAQYALYLRFLSTNEVYPSYNYVSDRYFGFSVRCLAR